MTYLLIFLASFYLLWVHFLAVMHLRDVEDKLSGLNLFLGKITLYIGLILDLFWQITWATLLWLELPKELTVSGRVMRLCKTGKGYRYNVAVWFKDTWLALFDKSGEHGEVSTSTLSDTVRRPDSP